MKFELSPCPSPRIGMPRLPRKRTLDTIAIIAFLLLALSSSWADYMPSPTSLVVARRVVLFSTASR